MNKYNVEINNKCEIFEFNNLAKQANGSVVLKVGDAVLLASVVSEFDNPTSEDFTPLTIQYIEKTYAAAKINGGFIKREGKPSDFETLTSRLIDRSLRPLFPANYNFPTTITILVLSMDNEVDLQVLALNVASSALYSSNLPIAKPVCGIRIGCIDDKFIINPTTSQMIQSSLDLFVSGTKEDLLMIEMKAINDDKSKQIDENKLLEAIKLSNDAILNQTNIYEKEFKNIIKDKYILKNKEIELDNKLYSYIKDSYTQDIKDAITKLAKSERSVALKDIANRVVDDKYCQDLDIEFNEILRIIEKLKKEFVRYDIIYNNIRADKRGLKDVRSIDIEINILPSSHGSCLFTRGETQALVVATLGNAKDAQMYEMLGDKNSQNENFMVHYNFHGFSVGEAKPIFGVSRRELGHGNLAKRALEGQVDKTYNKTIRLVSEILESNGSSSMATICGGSLALKAINAPIKSLVAGVAMGMIVQDDKYAILTDIMGLEDHDGDMDFKVAGTYDGITALQMDIKLGGIEIDILKESLFQAKEARIHILDIMSEASNNIIPSKALPSEECFKIDSKKIGVVIGKGGSTIKEIINNFNILVDVQKDSSEIILSGTKQNVIDGKKYIQDIILKDTRFDDIDFTKLYQIGEIYQGVVQKITDFGAFISLPKKGEGLLHISKLSNKRVDKVTDILSLSDEIEVKVIDIKPNKIELLLVGK